MSMTIGMVAIGTVHIVLGGQGLQIFGIWHGGPGGGSMGIKQSNRFTIYINGGFFLARAGTKVVLENDQRLSPWFDSSTKAVFSQAFPSNSQLNQAHRRQHQFPRNSLLIFLQFTRYCTPIRVPRKQNHRSCTARTHGLVSRCSVSLPVTSQCARDWRHQILYNKVHAKAKAPLMPIK